MAAKMSEMKSIVIEKKDGQKYKLTVPRDVINILQSKQTDPSVKDMITKSLLNSVQSKSSSQPSMTTSSQTNSSSLRNLSTVPKQSTSSSDAFCSKQDTSLSSQRRVLQSIQCRNTSPSMAITSSQTTCSTSTSQEPEGTSQSSVHTWKENEEDMLVSLRHDHEMHNKFLKSKNHNQLWMDISSEINRQLKCHTCITPTQAANKYNSLKKRWKEVRDSGTGTERKHFRQKEAFDVMFGTKASTKPSFIVDTLKEGENSKCINEEKKCSEKGKERIQRPVKRKSQELMDVLKNQHTEFQEKIQEFHGEQMQRMDRMLDLYEREIEYKMSKHDKQ